MKGSSYFGLFIHKFKNSFSYICSFRLFIDIYGLFNFSSAQLQGQPPPLNILIQAYWRHIFGECRDRVMGFLVYKSSNTEYEV